MLMMTHKADIEHIIHDLEQIETMNFDDGLQMEPLKHTRLKATEIIDEFRELIDTLEAEDYKNSGLIYDSEMIETMCMVAYYLCSFDASRLFGMDMTLANAVIECADRIGCTTESLMHMKNMYDNYFVNHAMGWPQNVVLNADMMHCIDRCSEMTETELAHACRLRLRQ